MIKAISTGKDGRKLVLLGLSELNTQKLKEGLPIHMHGEEIGCPVDIMICYGKTEDALRQELGSLIHPTETEVRDHRGKPKN